MKSSMVDVHWSDGERMGVGWRDGSHDGGGKHMGLEVKSSMLDARAWVRGGEDNNGGEQVGSMAKTMLVASRRGSR